MVLIFSLLSMAALAVEPQIAGEQQAKKWNVRWQSDMYMLGGTGDYLPFWQRTGHDGIIPNSTSGLLTAGADLSYNAGSGFFFEAGTNLVGSLEGPNPLSKTRINGIVDRLYASVGWRMLRLDVGMVPRERELGDLSITGGDIMYTRNARNLPGANIHSDWIYFEKGHWFGIKGNLAHYQTIDNRYVGGTLIHNKSVSFKVALGRKVDFIGGFEHWAQWAGNSPHLGKQPATFNDFIRIFFAKSGGSDASTSDQINVLGNHLGREYVRVNWRASAFTMTFQYDKPFEDGSGMRVQNVPDGVYTLKFALKDRQALVTDVLFEVISTTWQSGPLHDRPATEEEMAEQDPNDPYYGKVVLRGCDNYFSNGEYRSGWTNYGKVIGLPLIIPAAPNSDGKTLGIASNRVRGYHFGLQGLFVEKVPYSFKATYTNNWGRYHQGENFFADKPWQLSLGFELELDKRTTDLPLVFGIGAYADFGQLYQDSVGLTLKISYRDFKRF